MTNKLWTRDFSLLIGGQIISLFGNMILSFALPLYILYISGSASLFGLVLGLTNIPLLLMSPIGGMIADRFRKQRIMFWLDATTTVLIITYIALSGFTAVVLPIIIVKLMALNAIQGVYMPTVSATVPMIVQDQHLNTANAATNLVNAFSQMAGVAIAGVVFANFGLMPILVVSAVCFAVTAVMDLFIRVPFTPQAASGNFLDTAKADMKQSVRFMKQKPIIIRCAVIAFMISATLASMIVVGIPVIVTQILAMGMAYVGIAQGIMMVGGIAGGIMAGVLGSRLKVSGAYKLLLAPGFVMIPVGMALLINAPSFIIYVIFTAACTIALGFITIANVQIITLIQRETPAELIGKIMSLVLMLPFLANALGQFAYGIIFEYFIHAPYLIIFVTVILVVLIGLFTKFSIKEEPAHQKSDDDPALTANTQTTKSTTRKQT